MWGGARVAVVIPAYREERLLPTTLRGLPAWVDEVVVVDDASDDGTRAAALACAGGVGGAHTRLHVLTLPRNGGVGRAILTGYAEAARLGAAVAVVVGADAQMDPGEMGRLLSALDAGADYVKGERFSHPEVRARMPAARYWGGRALSLLTGLVAGLPALTDAQCGYTALRLSLLSALPVDALYPRYGFPNDLLLRLSEAGARVATVPVTPIYGSEVSKLSIPRVILPILWILARGAARRLRRGGRGAGAARA
ncbi:MAG: glycosyltransferase [Deltaproteobacteria bacterium]|nr:glycosyltransferase [Deltaproteobacteria bacterium]